MHLAIVCFIYVRSLTIKIITLIGNLAVEIELTGTKMKVFGKKIKAPRWMLIYYAAGYTGIALVVWLLD